MCRPIDGPRMADDCMAGARRAQAYPEYVIEFVKDGAATSTAPAPKAKGKSTVKKALAMLSPASKNARSAGSSSA